MDIRVNPKIIKELCGTVSFKRGEAFYRGDKVKIINYSNHRCVAKVAGADEFKVTIKKTGTDTFQSECSCPKLLSVKNECQHIAAVLLAIYHMKPSSAGPEEDRKVKFAENNELAGNLLTIFQQSPKRSSHHQQHFESRREVNVTFGLKIVEQSGQSAMIGIGIQIESKSVLHVRGFLTKVREGNSVILSDEFTYDPLQHCFEKKADDIIQQLITICADEKLYIESPDQVHLRAGEYLLIPPSTWPSLAQPLAQADLLKKESLQLTKDTLPLKFNFTESDSKNFVLTIEGIKKTVILKEYDFVLYEGQLFQLSSEDCIRLIQLNQLLVTSGTDEIRISREQISFFAEKIVPGLKRLGDVTINGDLTKEFYQTPLVAKLYLDRLNNVLLAGLEFHYENFVVNPFESRDLPGGSLLIRDLEKEAAIIEMIEDALFAKTDGGYYLQNEELEYGFLYHILPKLKKLLQVYATTAVRNRIFREKTKPQIRVKVKKERTNWLEFKFEMDGIPENQIREVLASLEVKRKYYRLQNGSLLSLETKEFEEIQRFLKAGPIQSEDLESGLNMPLVRGLRLMDAVGEDVLRLEDSFKQFLEQLRNPSGEKFVLSPSLNEIMRDYQKQGFQWLKTLASYGFGGILADEMGLGKTLQSIAFIQSELKSVREKHRPILIVCPSSLTYNWLSELMKFTPEIQAITVDGKKPEREELLKNNEHVDVMITSYMLLRRDIHLYEQLDFHTIFYDEAQYFKNPATQTAKAALRLKSEHRFALTGTPVENSSEELWSIFRVVFPELFHGLKEFSNLQRKTISRRIRPFMLRRTKEDVLGELPDKVEFTESAELLPDQKKLYAAYLAKLRHKTFKQLDKETIRKNRIKILSGLTRLRQICCHPALFVDGYHGTSAKFEQLLKLVEEARNSGRRVLIFSQFTKMLGLIGKEFSRQGLPYFYLDGQTPAEERLETCNRFNEGERDFFLISLKAGGTGLNLTGADTVILYDLWWNPAVEAQAADRAHRMGQKNTVQVIKLIARGTIEEKMNELQERKKLMISEIISQDGKGTASLTDEDIREILMI